MKKYPTSYVSREMQSKTMRFYHTPVRMTKICNLTPSAENKKYNRNSHVLLLGIMVQPLWCFCFCFFFNKIKHVLTMQFSSSIPWHLPKGVINICPHKSLYMDVYWNFIHNCQNLGSTKMFFSKWADKPWCIPDSGILFSAKRKWAVKHWRDMEEP